MNEHLTNDQLIDCLYGLENHAHLATCADCSRRLNEMQRVRASAAAPAPFTSDFLAAQRRKIYTRLGEPNRQANLAWLPALGAAALIAIGVAMYHPSPMAPQKSGADAGSDAQLFSEVYSMEQTDEPTVAAPLHSLFEDN